ncbi:hypothetical protein Tco_0289957 [Tanacetum coccineum]
MQDLLKLSEESKKRKPQVQLKSIVYKEDWDTIRAKLVANAELKERVLGRILTVKDLQKGSKVVSDVGEHEVDVFPLHLDFLPSVATTLANNMGDGVCEVFLLEIDFEGACGGDIDLSLGGGDDVLLFRFT